jgi:hypothetical protein
MLLVAVASSAARRHSRYFAKPSYYVLSGFGRFSAGVIFTTVHVTLAARLMTPTMKSARPRRPRSVVTTALG